MTQLMYKLLIQMNKRIMNASNFTSIMISSDDNNEWKVFFALSLVREVQFTRGLSISTFTRSSIFQEDLCF